MPLEITHDRQDIKRCGAPIDMLLIRHSAHSSIHSFNIQLGLSITIFYIRSK
jgi:hypothetical protein